MSERPVVTAADEADADNLRSALLSQGIAPVVDRLALALAVGWGRRDAKTDAEAAASAAREEGRREERTAIAAFIAGVAHDDPTLKALAVTIAARAGEKVKP